MAETDIVVIAETDIVVMADTNFFVMAETNFVVMADTNFVGAPDRRRYNADFNGLPPKRGGAAPCSHKETE